MNNPILLAMFVAGLGIVLLSSSPWIVLVAGLGVLAYYLYAVRDFRRYKDVGPQVKQQADRIGGLLLLIIAVKLFFLFGGYKFFLNQLSGLTS
jgi:hypothetical protein